MEGKKKRLLEIIKTHAYKEDKEKGFLLSSGKRSPYYINLRDVLLIPSYLELTLEVLWQEIRSRSLSFSAVAGKSMGADPLVYGLTLFYSDATSPIYPLILRSSAKAHGIPKKLEGRWDLVPKGGKVLMVDDVSTTGGSFLELLEELKGYPFQVSYAFSIVDREEGAKEALKEKGVELYSLFVLSDFSSS